MTWKLPPRIKVYEALGCIADGRLQVAGNQATVTSSAGEHTYSVRFDPIQRLITANDNGSRWQGYMGYPMIAFLMERKLLPFDQRLAQALRGIHWKKLNTSFRNDWKLTEDWIETHALPPHSISRADLEHFAASVAKEIDRLQFGKLHTKKVSQST